MTRRGPAHWLTIDEVDNVLAGKTIEGNDGAGPAIPFPIDYETSLELGLLVDKVSWVTRSDYNYPDARTALLRKVLTHLSTTGLQSPDALRDIDPHQLVQDILIAPQPASEQTAFEKAPLASLRAFGVILVSSLEEDFEGRPEAVRWARVLAEAAEKWNGMPWSGADAGVAKVAELYLARARETDLTLWDVRCLADLVIKAQRFPHEATLATDNVWVQEFQRATGDLQRVWADNLKR